MQGTGIDCLISQPGLVKTELNGRKLDHRKLSAIGVDLATKVYGQDASQAANCLIRPATDPTVEGEFLSSLEFALILLQNNLDGRVPDRLS